MEKSQYKICIEVLRRLHKAGVLRKFIVIGSWCAQFYKEYFNEQKYIPSIKTRDIDFLVPAPSKIYKKIDILELLKDLGFVKGFKGTKGYIKLEHPEVIIEFLVPERGRGSDKPYKLPQLGINAQTLRFLDFLNQKTIKVKIEDISITLPHPAYFSLHKLIVYQRRIDSEKKAKDIEVATKVLRALIDKGETRIIEVAFDSVPKRWKTKILKGLEKVNEEEIINILI